MNLLAFSTILGFLGGVTLIGMAIGTATDQYQIFASPASAYLVIGGTLSATFMSYNTKDVLGAIMGMARVFGSFSPINRQTLTADVNVFMDLSRTIRTSGIANLESSVPGRFLRIPIVKYGLELLSANYPPHEFRKMIGDFMIYDYENKGIHSQVLRTMGTLAPAFGLVGTVMGMVIILSDFGGDFAELGKGLSLALLTTLYGVILANFICFPMAEKNARWADQDFYRNSVLMEGFAALSERKSTVVIQDRMNGIISSHFVQKKGGK